jgi:hypothetical protein
MVLNYTKLSMTSFKASSSPNNRPPKGAMNFTKTLRPMDLSRSKISSVSQLINLIKSLSSITFSPWKRPGSLFLPKNPLEVTAITK